MKVAFLPGMLCAILVLASAVPINKNKPQESDNNANSADFIAEHDLNNLPNKEPIANDDKQTAKHGGGDVQIDANEIPDNDRTADDGKNDTSDDIAQNSDDIPVDDRETDDGKDSSVNDIDQPLNDIPNDDDRNDDNPTSQNISTTVRIVTPEEDTEKDNTTQETLPDIEKQATDETTPPRKRYVKQSTGEYRYRPQHKPRKTVTIPVSKIDKPGTNPSKSDDDKVIKGNQGRNPPGRKNPSPPSNPPPKKNPSPPSKPSKNPSPPKKEPKGSQRDKNPTTDNPNADSRIKRDSTSTSSGVTNDGLTEENTCLCHIVAKPNMECYRYTGAGKGACKLRMCGAQWECLNNGNSNNICIRKFATEKVTLIPGTRKCRTIRHPAKAYWVFYRKYTGPPRNKGKKVGQS